MDEILNPKQAATLLGIDEETVRLWCRTGRLPGIKMGGIWRLRRAALTEWLIARESPINPTEGGK